MSTKLRETEKAQNIDLPIGKNSADPSKLTSKKKNKRVEDLEVKDAQMIFQTVWHEIEQDVGVENLRFPAEIFWLNGAPGAGKGTQTAFIMEFRDLTEKPIIVSELLKSPEARKKIDAGLLAGDREVTKLVLKSLLNPSMKAGRLLMAFLGRKLKSNA